MRVQVRIEAHGDVIAVCVHVERVVRSFRYGCTCESTDQHADICGVVQRFFQDEPLGIALVSRLVEIPKGGFLHELEIPARMMR